MFPSGMNLVKYSHYTRKIICSTPAFSLKSMFATRFDKAVITIEMFS